MFHSSRPLLLVLAGSPGAGKTTLARLAARELGATYLRIDAIEQALRDSGRCAEDLGPAGYMTAYALARETLLLSQNAVADSVNPLAITREAWRNVARETDAACVEAEIICSDPVEHRRRVESRAIDIPGLVPPTWEQVLCHHHDPWDRPRVRIDTAGRTPEDCVAELLARLKTPTL